MKLKLLYLMPLILVAFGSCKQDGEIISLDVSSIFVINAVPDITAIKANTSGKPIGWNLNTDLIGYGANKFYYGPVGIVPITVVSAADTTKMLFSKNVTLQNKKVYSMYVFGGASNIDTMFREESNYPVIPLKIGAYNPTDSVTNVRFVNLSYGSPPLNIKIRNSTTNEVSNLAYKGISAFKGYANKVVAGTNYVFEIRDATTNVLFSTFVFQARTANQFRNVVIVIRGVFSPSATSPFIVSTVNYF